ncbi:MAG: hypothetical protein NXY57DRAFT_969458 [Lentinula lateritia]|nr:MAG: hypothetical protein NXY57DRAFT_969458 [Lentinula lateritia]
MAVRTLQVLTDNSPSTESSGDYDVFEEAAPFLVYIRDFWIGRANCPLFAEQVLLSAESLSLGLPIFLHDNLTQQWGVPPEHRSSAEHKLCPPGYFRRNREVESLKADASSFFASPRSTRSKDSNNELLSGLPLVDAAPQASSSAKASVGRKDPKSKTTVKVVEDSKASNPTPSGMAYTRLS